jgi:hypothetical protein
VHSCAFRQVYLFIFGQWNFLVLSEAAFSAEDRFRKLACADFELSAEVCCDFELGDKDAEE